MLLADIPLGLLTPLPVHRTDNSEEPHRYHCAAAGGFDSRKRSRRKVLHANMDARTEAKTRTSTVDAGLTGWTETARSPLSRVPPPKRRRP